MDPENHHPMPTGEKYTCEFCEKQFMSYAGLNYHRRKHTGESYSCDFCGKQFTCFANLKCHHQTHIIGKQHSCDVCNEKFNSVNSLKNHQRAHAGDISQSSDINKKQLCSFSKSKVISCAQTDKDNSPSDISQMQFEPVLDQKYYRTHTGEKPFSCNVSEEKCKTIAWRVTPKIYYCDICNKQFKKYSDRKSHYENMHSADKYYSCGICQKKFNFFVSLKRHSYTHTVEKLHSSDVSQKQFPLKKNLESFINKSKIYQCNVCQSQFNSVSDLNEHKNLCTEKTHHSPHTEKSIEEKSCNCKVCNKYFVDETQLATHFCFVAPTGFVCEICKKGFTKQSLLDEHHRFHSDKKPFACDLCPRTFAKRGDMIVHVRRVHKSYTIYFYNE